MHAADGEEIVGAAASVGEREVQIPALRQVEAVVEAEDVVRVVEAFLLSHADGLDEALPVFSSWKDGRVSEER